MVEVINADYSDYVSLSTKLVNVDGAVVRMRKPLNELRVSVHACALVCMYVLAKPCIGKHTFIRDVHAGASPCTHALVPLVSQMCLHSSGAGDVFARLLFPLPKAHYLCGVRLVRLRKSWYQSKSLLSVPLRPSTR